MRTFLRVLHITALAVGSFAMTAAVWTWFRSHSLEMTSVKDLANLAGLLIGVVFGAAVLWVSAHFRSTSVRATLLLYVGWVVVFTWYWFNVFPLGDVRELHSLEAGSVARERAQQARTSVSVFLLWVGLYSIGPILKAWDVRE